MPVIYPKKIRRAFKSIDLEVLKNEIINNVAEEIISILKQKEITKATCNDLEKHAYSVNDFIKDGDLRNSHILSGI